MAKEKKADRPRMKISAAAVNSAPKRESFDPTTLFVVAEPPPNVVPADQPRLACDDLYGWAGSNPALAGLSAGYYAFPGYPYLAALTQQSEYRQACETVAREMTRKWIRFKAIGGSAKKAAKIKALEKAMRAFDVQHKMRRCLELAENFGRAHLYFDMGVAENIENLPLVYRKETIKKGSLKNIKVVEPTWCYPQAYNSTNPLKEDFYRPNLWWVMQQSVHHTRLLTIIPHPVPDLLKPAYSFGGISLVQMLQVAVNNFQRTRQSVSDLVHSFSTPVFKTDMSATLFPAPGQPTTSDTLTQRVTMFNNYRDNSGCFAINAAPGDGGNGVGESLEIVATPLGTLDALQAQAQEQQAPVIGCPLVVLLGYTPAGLNASAEDQVRVWYDRTHANQENTIADALDTIVKVMMLHTFGDIDDDIDWEFEPLWQLDDAQLAAVQKSKADTMAVLVQEGLVSPENAQEAIVNDEASPFKGMKLDPPPGPIVDDPEGESGGEAPGEEKSEQRDED